MEIETEKELEKDESDLKDSFNEDELSDGYPHYCFIKLKQNPQLNSAICKNFYDSLGNTRNDTQKYMLLNELKNSCKGFIPLLISIATFSLRDIQYEDIKYSYRILIWLFTHFNDSEYEELFSPEIASALFMRIKETIKEEESIATHPMCLLDSFIKNKGKINIPQVQIHVKFFIEVLSSIENPEAQPGVCIPYALSLLGSYVSRFMKLIPEEIFMKAFSYSVMAIDKTPALNEGAISFWVNALIATDCGFLDFLAENSAIEQMNSFFVEGTLYYTKMVCMFVNIIAENSSTRQWNEIFLPNCDWQRFSALSVGQEFDIIAYTQCVDAVLSRNAELVPVLYEADVINAIVDYAANNYQENPVDKREEALGVLMFHVPNMSFDIIMSILENGIDTAMEDLVGFASSEQLEVIISSVCHMLQMFQTQSEEFQNSVAQKWSEIGLFEALRDAIESCEDNKETAEMCSDLLDDLESVK